MERSFMDAEQCAQLKKFAQVMAVQGGMRRITDDAWLRMQMALCGCMEPEPIPGQTNTLTLFGDKEWCYLLVKFYGNDQPGDNGLAALRVKRDYLKRQFAPAGIPNDLRMTTIFNGMLALLNVDPSTVDIKKLVNMDSRRN